VVEYPDDGAHPHRYTYTGKHAMTSSLPTSHSQSLVEKFMQQIFAAERNVVVLVLSEDNRVLDYDLRPLEDVVTLLDASGFGKPVTPDTAGILYQLIP